MKQRLLLALLMLLTSAGFMKADVTFTVPKGETATVTVSSGGNTIKLKVGNIEKELSGDVSYTIDKSEQGDQFVSLTGNGLLKLTIAGKASSLGVNDAYLQVLTASNVGLKELKTSDLSALVSLDLSSNELKQINVAAAKTLQTLNVANNKITDLGNLPASLLDLNIANNGFSISSVTWDLTTALPKLTKLNIDGNKLVDVKVPTTCTNFTKGIQDFTYQSQYQPNGSYVKANEDLDITKMAENYGLSLNISSATDWKKKVNSEYQATTEAQTIGTGNSIIYRFFDANKVYTKGTIISPGKSNEDSGNI